MEAKRQWNDIIKVKKENNFQSRILQPGKIPLED